MSKHNNKKQQSAQVIDAGLGELNKVRDILFGREISAVDGRLESLELNFQDKLDELTEKINIQINDAVTKMQLRLETVSNKLANDLSSESEHRTSEVDKVQSSLEQSLNEVQKNITQSILSTEDSMQQDVLELRHYTENQFKNNDKAVVDNIDNLRNELLSIIEKQSSEVKDQKLSREALALMLDEVTVRLRKERS